MESVKPSQAAPGNIAQTTVFLVLGTETVLFGTLVMSYLFLRAGGTETAFVHPKPLDVMIAGSNTLILLASAFFAWNSHRSIQRDDIRSLKTDLLVTLLLGITFIVGQIFEFQHSGTRINTSIFASVFFALISFHALHVLAGMLILSLNFVRAHVGDFRAERHVSITVGTWFWYYVTIVWLVLFTVLFLV